ncbi:MAG: phospholipid carrier-dependent glycosyltransferase, partial [Chloroflexota bacterium]|nr:phospholipid carrier-dependent glycosyltransferase [Chloroflexota bacterium]
MSDSVQQAAPSRRGLLRVPTLSLDTLLLAGLFLGALTLRAWGVQWSLPYVGHVDEPKIVDSAVHMVKTGDLNPHLFIWPSGVIYLQALIYQVNLLWGTWRGYYHGPGSLPDSNHVFAVAPDLYLWGRLFSATVGAVAVAGVYALGRRLIGRAAALIAAGLLATSPLHVEYSHYLVTDVTMGAAGLLALAAAWHLLQQPSRRSALLAGAAVGLAAAAKYNGLYTVIPVATAWAWTAWSGRQPAFAP